jgi:hypothetical protein
MKNPVKLGSAVRDLGVSMDDFLVYLEALWKPGMTWENYGKGKGKWNIDHIKPMARFDLFKRKEVLEACHYTNLQPLWWWENIAKRAHYSEPG